MKKCSHNESISSFIGIYIGEDIKKSLNIIFCYIHAEAPGEELGIGFIIAHGIDHNVAEFYKEVGLIIVVV